MTPPAPAPGPRVCVLVLNWDQPEMTLRCVRNLLAQAFPPGFDALVIDNGSTPANLAALRAGLPPGCRFARTERNRGFAGGMNVGIRYALRRGYEYVWLLNNDAFPDAGCLAHLAAAMDADPTLAAVTPRLRYPDGSDQPLGGRVDWETGGICPRLGDQLPRPTPVGYYVTGAAMLVRAAALRAVGGFDPRFFAYWEEFDLCTRMLRRGGWNLGVVGAARCVHWEQATSGARSPVVVYLMSRNAWLFVRKHRPVWAWPRLWLRQAAVQVVHAGAHAARGHRPQALAVLAAVWAGLTSRFHRPRRLTVPEAVGGPVLRHFWGVARGLWGASNLIAPPAARRPLPGQPGPPAGGAP